MKKDVKKPAASRTNIPLINAISPSGFDFDSTHANMGDNYGAIYFISGYKANPDYGWLSELCDIEGTATVAEWRYTDNGRITQVYNKKVQEYEGDLPMKKEESEKQLLEKRIKDLRALIRKLAVDKEPVGYLNILLYVQASTESKFEDRVKKVSGIVAASSCSMKLLKYRQFEGIQSVSPYGLPVPEVSHQGDRNMPASTFFGGFPMANSGIYDDCGIYIGKTKNSKLVILNDWLRGGDRVNSNWLITGIPGTGKSTLIKDLMIKEMAVFGTSFIVFDAEQEYIDFANDPDVNGVVIDCMAGTTGRINPLQVRVAPRVERSDFETEDEYEREKRSCYIYEDEGNGISDLALYIQNLRTFFKMYWGDSFTTRKKTILEKLLIEMYEKHGITWDTDITELYPEDFPIFTDLYELTEKHAAADTEDRIYSQLLDDLYSVAKGADKFMWNGPTTLSIDNEKSFCVIDCSKLLETDDNVKRAGFFNLQLWAWQQLAADRTKKTVLMEDEGYLYVDPEYPEMMKMNRNIAKRARKYEAALWFITHSIVDVLDGSVKRLGQAIIDSACYKLFMGCDGKNLKETAELFELSDEEVNVLASKVRGRGLLIAGSTRMELKVQVRDSLLERFGKTGGR